MAHERFVNNALSELQEANRSPIYGYQHLPVLTLEQAIDTIIQRVPGVDDCVSTAKKKCNKSSTLLTWDESAAIYLYSMPTSFVSRLNEDLRAENRHKLKPWFAYLKLFITALEKLPSTKGTIWRGVSGDVGTKFTNNDLHIWWSVNSCSMALNVVEMFLGEKGTVFAIDAIHGKDIAQFSAFPEEQEIVLMPGARVRAKSKSLNFIDRFFLVSLEEENSPSESQTEPNYLFELIKQEYQENSHIKRIVNPSKSFPIEQSYINLAIVETKEQQETEKKLLNAKLDSDIIGTFEEIYGTKTKIGIKDVFEKYKGQATKILVLGRAGIGKTTFCQYVTYQWAIGAIWQEYDLVIFIQLRNLMENRYPPLAPGAKYSLFDLIKKEYFYYDLSDKDERLLKEQFGKSRVLWLLDGYDEIIQNVPVHLQYLFEQLLKTPHHILTSRPYLNTLSYNVKLEITGFIDDDIKKYVEQFFDQIKDEIDNPLIQSQNLLNFLKFNLRIWGIVHIPVNLELICSLWCDTDWEETTTMTMTTVYDKMTEWLCRRYLEKQDTTSRQMVKEKIYEHCHKELAFLESLAFNAMESNNIILRPKLLRKASDESECSLQHQSNVLNIGILKSLHYKPIGTDTEADKNHYFLHLSFQEHFSARYLVKALSSDTHHKKRAINFIKAQKYNQRFELVFTFASGLLNDSDLQQSINLFWKTLLGEPLDLIGLRHVQLVISCMEETGCNRSLPRFYESMSEVIKWISYFISERKNYPLIVSLQRSRALLNQPEILEIIVNLLNHADLSIKKCGYSLISALEIANLDLDLISLHLTALNHHDVQIRASACEALGNLGDQTATNDILNGLLRALDDTNGFVRENACEALGKMGEKATTNEILNKLVSAMGDWVVSVQCKACETLVKISEKAATDEIINRLISLPDDRNAEIRKRAFETLLKIGEKTASTEIVDRLASIFRGTNCFLKIRACEVLSKMGEKAANSEIITGLASALADTDCLLKISACKVLGRMGEKAATTEIITGLANALVDTSVLVRSSACEALGRMGEKATTAEIVDRLEGALGDTNVEVRSTACEALSKMGEKAATTEIITGLVNALEDTRVQVRRSACEALGRIDEKVATPEIVDRLASVLGDLNHIPRSRACETLGRMGEKAAITELVDRLASVIRDSNDFLKISACKALDRIGEKAATPEIVDGLASALGNSNEILRSSACEALCRMGEKAATTEIINRLLDALGHWDVTVRSNVCKTLVKISDKTATNEIVTGLVKALGDRNALVRRSACEVLSNLGEKAATNEIIDRLASALGNTDVDTRRRACKAVGRMGVKAATNEVISRLLDACDDKDSDVQIEAVKSIGNILGWLPSILVLKDDTVSKLAKHIEISKWWFVDHISPEKLIRAFLDTENSVWLPAIKTVSIRNVYGITVTENTLTVYDSKGPVELFFSKRQLGQQLHDYFFDWLDRFFENANEVESCMVSEENA